MVELRTMLRVRDTHWGEISLYVLLKSSKLGEGVAGVQVPVLVPEKGGAEKGWGVSAASH